MDSTDKDSVGPLHAEDAQAFSQASLALYRGFVPVNDDKSPSRRFSRGQELMGLEQARMHRGFGGVLSDTALLIDIDDAAQAELLAGMVEDMQVNCRITETTRGKHFLFVNSGVSQCYTGVTLACGLTADIKVGLKNSYQILKLTGDERYCEWDIQGESADELPSWLKPIKGGHDFFHLYEGSRNTTLYSYILKLKSAGMTDDEIRECERIINTYILKEPLSEEELETILRSESFQKPSFFIKGKFAHEKMGDYLIQKHNAKLIDGRIHLFCGTHYVADNKDVERAIISEIPSLKQAQRNEVVKYLLAMCEETDQADPKFISFANGILNIETGELLEHSPHIVITNHIPHNYDVSAYSEVADATMDRIACDNDSVRDVLEELIGNTFYRASTYAAAAFLIGDGSNGKSTFLKALTMILGPENTSSLDVRQMAERFMTAELAGKLANIGDDMSSEYLNGNAMAIFKKVVTGDALQGEYKGMNPFTFRPFTKLLFSVNEMPRMNDRSHGLTRRMLPIPFNARFSPEDADFNPNINDDFTSCESLEYLIACGVDGLKRLIAQKHFTRNDYHDELLDEIRVANNPLLEWFEDRDRDWFIGKTNQEVYSDYRVWCDDNGLAQPVSQRKLTAEVKKRYTIDVRAQRQNGKVVKAYVYPYSDGGL